MNEVSHNLEEAREDLTHAMKSLKNMAAEKNSLHRGLIASENKLTKTNDTYQSTLNDLFHVEDDLLAENVRIFEKVASLEPKLLTCWEKSSTQVYS